MRTPLAIILSISIFTISCKKQNNIPHYDHVIIVIEENHGYPEIIGSATAPYINQLAREGALFINSKAITHPSQPNYLILFSGSAQGSADDACPDSISPYTTPNLGAALIEKGFSFKGYAQTMPSIGYLGCKYGESNITGTHLYARKHCPWVNWIGNKTNNIPASASLPMTEFPKDYSQLPTVSFVIPDMDYDMHNIGSPGDSAAIKRGDDWLKENLSGYAQWAKDHNSLLIVTVDEDDGHFQNQVATFFYGAHIVSGDYETSINHFSLLHTLEAMYNLQVTDTSKAAPVMGIWNK